MTPLAARFAKDLTLRRADRLFLDPMGVLPRILEAKCFEVTQIEDLIWDMTIKKAEGQLNPWLNKYVFLPAPVTWIEGTLEGARDAMLLLDNGKNAKVYYVSSYERPDVFPVGEIGLIHKHKAPECYRELRVDFEAIETQFRDGKDDDLLEWAQTVLMHVRCALMLINTPKLLGHRSHNPHRGLERRLLNARKIYGKFPLQAWTEIFLDCGPPRIAGEGSQEAHLTGMRCLHWVRAFIRFRRGRYEKVRDHWRGDASLGMKRSRYICRPRSDH